MSGEPCQFALLACGFVNCPYRSFGFFVSVCHHLVLVPCSVLCLVVFCQFSRAFGFCRAATNLQQVLCSTVTSDWTAKLLHTTAKLRLIGEHTRTQHILVLFLLFCAVVSTVPTRTASFSCSPHALVFIASTVSIFPIHCVRWSWHHTDLSGYGDHFRFGLEPAE